MEDANINESALTPGQSDQPIEEKIVGFEDDAKNIIKLLIRGTRELDIVSIFGMPGLGKTYLATKVFNDSSIVSHFDIRALITISQSYNVKELLKSIYKHVTREECDTDDRSVIADKLRRHLIGKRYLIFLDDIWEFKAWEELKSCFPIGVSGNRIMLTTRLEHVAKEVKCCTDPYSLRFLTVDESWKLLQKKVFQNDTCPPKFRDVGRQLAQYCNGLPLAIVLIGGIIVNKQTNVSEWYEVANNIKSYFRVESETNFAIQLSYSYLPYYLRRCFLMMGIFREDEKVVASKLMSLWMAEGFVECNDERKLEEVVEGYLMDLISSSLLMVSKTTFNGKAKYLQIHDLVHEFCVSKAKEEKFMQVVGPHNNYEPSYDGEDRVCIHLDENLRRDLLSSGNTVLGTFGKNVTSLFVTNDEGNFVTSENPTGIYYLRSVGDFKYLRVLDLLNCFLLHYQMYILESLVDLRYLGLRCYEFSFKWVSHLCHLETLTVRSEHIGEATPHIWKMTKLRYLSEVIYFPPQEVVISNELIPKLENLRTFEAMGLSDGDLEVLIERFPNLQKLILIVVNNDGRTTLDVMKLEVLAQLQSLLLVTGPSEQATGLSITKYCLPSSLKELILAHCQVPTNATSTIAVLPNLERLKFKECVFEQSEWDVRDIEFPVLKNLKLLRVDLKQWHVSESSFPNLEILVLKDCPELETIPFSFADVQALNLIKVISCQKLNASALEIKEEVEIMTGSDKLKVHISPPYSRDNEEEGIEEDVHTSSPASRGTVDEFTNNEIKKIFSHLDDDGDGLLIIEDLIKAFISSLEANEYRAKILDMINEADADGDGAIDFPEFLKLMTREMENGATFRELLLQSFFRMFDEDQDGFISAFVLRQSIMRYGDHAEEEADEMVRKAAVNGDGRISYEEFIKIMIPTKTPNIYKLTDSQISTFKNAFSQLDEDRDGLITSKELRVATLRIFGQNSTDAELQDMINEADADGDGAISCPEFLDLIAHHIRNNFAIIDISKKVFRMYDEDNDGLISAVAFHRIIRAQGKLTREEVDEIARKADVNGDGQISKSSFVLAAMIMMHNNKKEEKEEDQEQAEEQDKEKAIDGCDSHEVHTSPPYSQENKEINEKNVKEKVEAKAGAEEKEEEEGEDVAKAKESNKEGKEVKEGRRKRGRTREREGGVVSRTSGLVRTMWKLLKKISKVWRVSKGRE